MLWFKSIKQKLKTNAHRDQARRSRIVKQTGNKGPGCRWSLWLIGDSTAHLKVTSTHWFQLGVVMQGPVLLDLIFKEFAFQVLCKTSKCWQLIEKINEHVWAKQNKSTSQIWPWDTSVWPLVKEPEKIQEKHTHKKIDGTVSRQKFQWLGKPKASLTLTYKTWDRCHADMFTHSDWWMDASTRIHLRLL